MKLFIIDLNPLFIRSYCSLKSKGFSNSAGEPTFAVYGFFRTFFQYLKKLNPDYIIVADDSPSYRKAINENYKATRTSERQDDFSSQKKAVVKGLSLLGVPTLKIDSFEADDIISHLSRINELIISNENGYDTAVEITEKHVLTIDYDLVQLVANGNVTVHVFKTTKTTEIYANDEAVIKKFEVPAKLLPMYKSVVGDKSDNLLGVGGIGSKKFQTKIVKDKSYDELFNTIPENLGMNEKQLEIYYQNMLLVNLNKDMNIVLDLQEEEINMKEMQNYFLNVMEFKSIAKNIQKIKHKTLSNYD